MQRRTFLKLIGLGSTGAALANGHEQTPTNDLDKLGPFTVSVVALQYLQPGEIVELTPEVSGTVTGSRPAIPGDQVQIRLVGKTNLKVLR